MKKNGFTLLECLLYISLLSTLLPLVGYFHFHFQNIHKTIEKEINLIYEWQFMAKIIKEDLVNADLIKIQKEKIELLNSQESIQYQIKKKQLHRSSSPNYISLCISKTFKVSHFSNKNQQLILHSQDEKNNIILSL